MSLNIWNRLLRAPYGGAVALSILLQGLALSMISPLLPVLLAERIGMSKNDIIVFYLLNTLMSAVVVLGTALSTGVLRLPGRKRTA